MTFEYHQDIELCNEIKFNPGMNVLIGPNGSGKSNFLEILNKLFNNALIQTTEYSETSIRSWEIKGRHKGIPPDFRNSIRSELKKFPVITNKNSGSNKIKIQIEIQLTKKDIENLFFIHQNSTELNEIGMQYSQVFPNFPQVDFKDLEKLNSLTLIFENQSAEYLTEISNYQGVELFTYFYINHFNQIQYVIELARKRHQKNWPYLNNNFAILSSLRNYNQIDSIVQIQSSEEDEISSAKLSMANENLLHNDQNEPHIFRYLFKKFGYAFHRHIREKALKEGYDPMSDFIDPLFLKINQILEDTVELKLYIRQPDPNQLTYYFDFMDSKTGKLASISELSSGEKGLIHFIFCIYGNDLFNGVMIIDEPEIHMHPQMQETCLKFMKKMVDEGMQFIIATHSPIFVNEKTIDGIRRFYLDDNGFTKVIIPYIGNKEKELIQILSYTNSSKIFFSDKVVLVEGDSDEYFFRFYFDKYKEVKAINKNVDFLYIGGKDKIGYWKKFLTNCKINSYYIGDLDNVSGGQSAETVTKDSKNIFILKQGDLETYIGKIRHNKLENAIDFCKNRYDTWKIEPSNKEKIDELNEIFDEITTS